MIKVKNIMTKAVITISSNSSIKEAAKLMNSKSVSSLVVVEKNMPVAIVSEKDIINGIISKENKVKEIMDREFIIISPITKFLEISKHLREKKIRVFPVVQDNNLIGLVTETDMIEATRDFTRFHQIVQEIILTVFGLATAFFLFYFSPLRASILG